MITTTPLQNWMLWQIEDAGFDDYIPALYNGMAEKMELIGGTIEDKAMLLESLLTDLCDRGLLGVCERKKTGGYEDYSLAKTRSLLPWTRHMAYDNNEKLWQWAVPNAEIPLIVFLTEEGKKYMDHLHEHPWHKVPVTH